jgi:hypothetical protein
MSVIKLHAFIYFLRPPPWSGTLICRSVIALITHLHPSSVALKRQSTRFFYFRFSLNDLSRSQCVYMPRSENFEFCRICVKLFVFEISRNRLLHKPCVKHLYNFFLVSSALHTYMLVSCFSAPLKARGVLQKCSEFLPAANSDSLV